jgi:hypothetical protein
VVSSAQPGLREEDESIVASAGHWAASEKGGGRSTGLSMEKKKKEGGLGWLQGELGFGPSPSRI